MGNDVQAGSRRWEGVVCAVQKLPQGLQRGRDSLYPGELFHPENSDRTFTSSSPKNLHVASHLVLYFGIYYAFLG